MSSALLMFDVNERKRIASGALAPLAAALRAELQPLIDGKLPIPERKARLTRIGGRCALDGMLLRFDPFSPDEHECPQCHRVYSGTEHHDWWALGAQLWTAERAVQAATIGLLCDDADASRLATRILIEFAVRYTSWPNRDNALGPTRPFFSTYLESIWLLNICHAIALLESSEQHTTLGNSRPLDQRTRQSLAEVRNMLVLPSRNLIASFNEGHSNRQVWNEAAILSASHLLKDEKTLSRRLSSNTGLSAVLTHGLLEDGMWYEGENYHLFAHRGLWYGMQLLRALGRPLTPHLNARFNAGFGAPFLGLLPDDTVPSRRDSQYKVSIRQWRFAEWCELGLAQIPANEQLAGILHRLYGDTTHTNSRQHKFSTADSERNEGPSQLDRSNLSWRALLMANEGLPPLADWHPQSICLPMIGLAVLRRDEGRTYVALEGGHTGGGHGHPDRLSLTLQHNETRWLEDPGTGSYVERALHWYRSTLAHFAPLFDGASQTPRPAILLAFEERGGAGWICKRVEEIAPGVNATRTIVVADGYLVDVLEWDSEAEHQIDLPVARVAEVTSNTTWTAQDPMGAEGLEDGFEFLSDIFATIVGSSVTSFNVPGAVSATAFYRTTGDATLWRAEAPGSPGHDRTQLHFIRTRGAVGRIVGVLSWKGSVSAVDIDAAVNPPVIVVTTLEGTIARHTRSPGGWHIALEARHATSSIDLGGVVVQMPAQEHDDVVDDDSHANRAVAVQARGSRAGHTKARRADKMNNKHESARHALTIPAVNSVATETANVAGHPISNALRFHLGESHYVQTEQSWTDAQQPSAIVQIGATEAHMIIDVLARTGPVVVPGPRDENVLDNERRDVNSDGLQLHIGLNNASSWSSSWLAVPASETAPHARVTATIPNSPALWTAWTKIPDGWAMRALIPRSAIPAQADGSFAMEIIINERSSDRQRRRGQLVLSGGGGYGYLRGDRADASRVQLFRIGAVNATTPIS